MHHLAIATVSLVSPDLDKVITIESFDSDLCPLTRSSAACSTKTGFSVTCFAISPIAIIGAKLPPTAVKNIFLYPLTDNSSATFSA